MSLCLPTHLELRPVHGHVDPVRVGPQPQVFVVVRVVHRVVKLLVDLRQAAKLREIIISGASLNPDSSLGGTSLYLLFILGDVEDFLEGEEGFLELLQPLRLRHLTPLEHLRHVLDVLWVGFNFESERLRDIS